MAIISNGTTIASGGSLSVSVNPPSTAGAVGTYAIMGAPSYDQALGQGTKSFGGTYAGSNLKPRSCGSYESGGVTSTQSGTWRCMGYKAAINYDTENSTTLWIRIS